MLRVVLFATLLVVTFAGECNDDGAPVSDTSQVCCGCCSCCTDCCNGDNSIIYCPYNGDWQAGGGRGNEVVTTIEYVPISGTEYFPDEITCSNDDRMVKACDKDCSANACMRYCEDHVDDNEGTSDCKYIFSSTKGECFLFDKCILNQQRSTKGVTYERVVTEEVVDTTTVMCMVMADDILWEVWYGDTMLAYEGDYDDWNQEKTFIYTPRVNGVLAVYVQNTGFAAGLQIACDDGLVTTANWISYGSNSYQPPRDWYKSSFDDSAWGTSCVVDSNWELSASARTIWNCYSYNNVWFRFIPYTTPVRRELTQTMTQTSTTSTGTNSSVYTVYTHWSFYADGEELYNYETQMPSMVFEALEGCHTLDEFIVKYDAWCGESRCDKTASQVDSNLSSQSVDEVCISQADYQDTRHTYLADDMNDASADDENNNSEDEYTAAEFWAVTTVMIILALCVCAGIGHCCYRRKVEAAAPPYAPYSRVDM